MKTIEEQVNEIKHYGECAVYGMENHKVVYLPDDGSFNDIINAMHNAQNKDTLAEVYYNYIINAISHGYSDGEIIGGIMQNEEQNEKFSINIESVIKSLINIKYTRIDLDSPTKSTESTNTNEHKKSFSEKAQAAFNDSTGKTNNEHKKSFPEKVRAAFNDNTGKPKTNNEQNNGPIINAEASDIPVNDTSDKDKLFNKIHKKMNYIESVVNALTTNKSQSVAHDINLVKTTVKQINDLVLSVDPKKYEPKDIATLNNLSAKANSYLDIVAKIEMGNTNTVVSKDKQQGEVEQQAVAHTEGGFNITNFIKPNQQPIAGPNMPNPNRMQQQKTSVLPHEICGLTDEQMIEEVKKHFKIIQPVNTYPLYDLLKNKILAHKMKELNAKQRSNNPYLTQVNINEYIDIPELLAHYNLCFTIPCNEKDKVIVVLYNSNLVRDNTGALNYPLNIFKATLTNKKK